ncbi:MAG: DsrE/DsrF/DrsH-like family protein [Candidatus Margulisbacteria bacterium]|nr:DsrE/DsrF/DrsH-like family protein [Candidatus Margulisiibacteriota bacterium]MBU1022359.1 DsrE/DsrF/DrsH-like family protein [Candidatus Margulisiibacteriota bacterium]MBU1729089.1 DsrE/DsrF/DrsH-like family protein [Candidatus Margulisiibacteriota bacterium]MBU1954490.1 DsrE/DsrF/DrsH-like family protein [Candidatus Margulisiibacteriota bacterium]
MEKEKFNIVVFSGDMDKVLAAFILATTAASMGMETSMFFTFWGLNVLRKKKLTSGKNILQKMMNFMNQGGASRLSLSKFNMLGMGPAMMKVLMKQAKVPSIEEFIKTAKGLGVKLIACTTTFSFMGFEKDDFIDGIDSYAGAATFMGMACEGKVSYFI